MTNTKLGTLPGTWPFTCSVIKVDEELPGKAPVGRDIAALHSGKFWNMRIRIENKYVDDPRFDSFLHHEHKHALDKSNLLHFLKKDSEKERRAEAHAVLMSGEPVPWMSDKDVKVRKAWRWLILAAIFAGLYMAGTV